MHFQKIVGAKALLRTLFGPASREARNAARSQLLAHGVSLDGLMARIEDQLRARLAELGVTGRRAEEMLAMQMNVLRYLAIGHHGRWKKEVAYSGIVPKQCSAGFFRSSWTTTVDLQARSS